MKKESDGIRKEEANVIHKRAMTYEEVVAMLRHVFENADARNIFEHIAFEIDLVGEPEGALYMEIAQRAVCIEPYNYYDHDGLITTNAFIVRQIAEGKLGFTEALDKGLVRYEGDMRKLELCLDKLVLFR